MAQLIDSDFYKNEPGTNIDFKSSLKFQIERLDKLQKEYNYSIDMERKMELLNEIQICTENINHCKFKISESIPIK